MSRAVLKNDGGTTDTCHVQGRTRIASEAGVTLIETVVAAVVLAIAAGAVLTLLVGSTRASVGNRDRVTASALAEQDQERLRATKFTQLAALATAGTTQASTKTVGAVVYKVESSAQWENDAAGFQPTCTSGTDGTSDYLRITSVVTPDPLPPGVREQRITSLLAPKVSTIGVKGTLSVPFIDRDGDPLDGVPVSVTGAATGSATSNTAGCAVFTYYPAGNYTATYSRSGYVTPGGSAAAQTVSAVVNPARTSFTEKQTYDKASSISASIVTRATSAATRTTGAVTAVSASNVGIGNSTNTLTATSGSRATAFTIGNLFPFDDGYAVYAGACAANDPTKYGLTAAAATMTPGLATSVNVFAPTLTARVPGYSYRRLVVTSADTGCSQRYVLTFNPASSASIQVPFGTYTVCGDDGSYRASRSNVRVVTEAATELTFSVNEAQEGTCP